MPAEMEPPAKEPPTRGRGRGGRGRGGRGSRGGRGGSNAAVSKNAASAKTGRGGSRRGRAKNFADTHVQASYERQRQLKATYQAVAHALKPALQELADRNIEELMSDPDAYKRCPEYRELYEQLEANMERKLAMLDAEHEQQQRLAAQVYKAAVYVAEQEYTNGYDDLEEQFQDGLENRARILGAMHARGLPVDVRDDQYEYKVITDEHYDTEFGTYETIKNGHLVPYPARVEGTYMWQKAREHQAAAEAAQAAANAAPSPAPATSTNSRGGRGRTRGGVKRRAEQQPEGQPTPKKITRGTEDAASAAARGPAPAKGLLASAAEVEDAPEGTPGGDEDSVPASPEPPAFTNGSASAAAKFGKLPPRERSPTLPKQITDPDEYGFRIYNQGKAIKDRGPASRLYMPAIFQFEDWEIGFKDSINDSTKGHTHSKRGKYLDTPNSNGMHFDHWTSGYDFTATVTEDFDPELVRRHQLHPVYGIPLPGSVHKHELPSPYVMPGKPVVYIANPSGRIHHASRSFLKTTNTRRSEDEPVRTKMKASMRRFCKINDVDANDISITEYLPTDEELREKSLGTAVQELESRPVVKEEESEPEEVTPEVEPTPEPETGFTDLSILSYAGAYIEAEAQEATAKAVRPAPKPARYDAIRDVFTDSKPAAPPTPESDADMGLKILATLSNVVSFSDDPNATQSTVFKTTNNDIIPEPSLRDTVPESDIRSVMPEPEIRTTVLESGLRSTIPESDIRSTMPEPDLRSSMPRVEEQPPVITHHAPMDSRYNPTEPPAYMQAQSHAQPPMQPIGPVHTLPAETMPYPSVHDHAVPPHQLVRPSEYPPPPPPGPPVPDRGPYMSHGGYPGQDHRDVHMAPGRPIDPGYHSRRMSGYAEDPTYPRYWNQGPPPPGPPPPPAPAPGPSPHFQSARIPFSVNASAEPLPPLRPSRGRNHSIEESMMDSNMRPVHNNHGPPYYPPGPSMSYHGYPGPEPPLGPPPPLQPLSTDRILPNPQPNQGYMTSPNLGYAHQVLSPTYANPPPMASMAQSPQEIPPGLPLNAHHHHHHRSTPSGDAGNKYRKLQPAPVPAHRVWGSKPELKTIPYDHKETGSGAALPSSGPTQIRGWSVNQPRKRGHGKFFGDLQSAASRPIKETATKRVTRAASKELSADVEVIEPVVITKTRIAKRKAEVIEEEEPIIQPRNTKRKTRVAEPEEPTTGNRGIKNTTEVIDTDEAITIESAGKALEAVTPLKQRLRPRKAPAVEPEVVITGVRSSNKGEKTTQTASAAKKKTPAPRKPAARKGKTQQVEAATEGRFSVEVEEVKKVKKPQPKAKTKAKAGNNSKKPIEILDTDVE